MKDEVVEEVRRASEADGERFHFDLDAIFEDLSLRDRESGREDVTLPRWRIVPTGDIPLASQAEATPTTEIVPTAAETH